MTSTNTSLPPGVTSGPGSVSATPGATTAKGGSFSTGSFIAGILTGLATAGILYVVSGKGKRSKASGSALPEPYDDPTLVPSPSPAVDAHDDVTEVEELTHAPAGQAKLTDEDVETIRAMKAAGKSVKEIATLYGVSPKTVYSRIKKNNNPEKPKIDD